MKKLLASVLTLAILLTSCTSIPKSNSSGTNTSPKANGTVAMGRWVEQKFEIDGQYRLSNIVQQEDGSLYAIGTNNEAKNIKLTSTDMGVTWQEELLEIINSPSSYMIMTTICSNGDIVFAKALNENTGEPAKYTVWHRKVGEEAVMLNLPDLNTVSQLRSMVLISDDVAIITWDNITAASVSTFGAIYDLKAQTKIKDLDSSEISFENGELFFLPMVRIGDELFYAGYTMTADKSMTLKKITIDGTITTVQDKLPIHQEASTDSEGNYYFINKDGISRLAKNGSIVENIVTGNTFMFSAPDTVATNLTRLSDGSFIINQMSGNSNENMKQEMYRYYFDESVPSENANVLKVWSLETNETVRTAIIEFAKKHSDISVEYEIAITPENEDSISKKDVISSLNTALLAGEGPDIIVFDNIDYTPYIQKGLLQDLSTVLDTKALLPNITSPFIQEGKAYVMPAKYSVPIIYGTLENVAKITSLQTLKDVIIAAPPRPNIGGEDEQYYNELAPKDKYALGLIDLQQLFEFTMQTSASALIKDNVIDELALKEMLEFIKAVSDHSDISNYSEHLTNGVIMTGGGGDALSLYDGGYEYAFTGNALYGWDVMSTSAMLSAISKAKDKVYPDANAIIQPGLCENAYLPSAIAAISASSKNKQAAADFVANMFSEVVQNQFSGDGNAVSISGHEQMLKRNKSSIKPFYKGDVTALYASAKTPVIINIEVFDVIYKHVELLCQNKQSVDDAIKGVKNDLAIYLEERA